MNKTTLRHQVDAVLLVEHRTNAPYHSISINKFDLWPDANAQYPTISLTPEELDIRLQNKVLPRTSSGAQDAPPEGTPHLIVPITYARKQLTCIPSSGVESVTSGTKTVILYYDPYSDVQYFRLYHDLVSYLYEPLIFTLRYRYYGKSLDKLPLMSLSLNGSIHQDIGDPTCGQAQDTVKLLRRCKTYRIMKKKAREDDFFLNDCD
ncbi:hypothetical protein BXZ70DRAFT_1011666 [Cristinia sonorae]|uniref:Uncharacterized protein n=1 Tax=Cristinia sonorae TaxID=1940300 RepID=A0A8K0UID1_9AGAR|nr:hypothetical protein BXZ70DRAFT_1011666 [Cristinia sonorae]